MEKLTAVLLLCVCSALGNDINNKLDLDSGMNPYRDPLDIDKGFCPYCDPMGLDNGFNPYRDPMMALGLLDLDLDLKLGLAPTPNGTQAGPITQSSMFFPPPFPFYSEAKEGGDTMCSSDNQCPGVLKCFSEICRNPCEYNPCGENTECRSVNHARICECKDGFKGDAEKGCEPENYNECHSNKNCPYDQECVEGQCVKVCKDKKCGKNAVCLPQNHVAVCSCSHGYSGDAYKECQVDENISCSYQEHCPDDMMCMNLKCVNTCAERCGANTNCIPYNHDAVCTCKPGYIGDPFTGCVEDNENKCDDDECTGHDQCPSSKICIKNLCKDPCEGLCGNNTLCRVYNHIPSCECIKGSSGNPFVECTGATKEDPEPKCKGVWPPAKAGKKKFSLEAEAKVGWNAAYLQCYKKGYRLATIDTLAEGEELNKLIQSKLRNNIFWIGGIGRGANDIPWMWMATEEKINAKVAQWLTNRPHLPRERNHCLSLREINSNGYKWEDRNCKEERHFVCEYY